MIASAANGGGTKTPADFTIHVTTGGIDVSGSPKAGSGTGSSYTLLPGTYNVSEGSVSDFYLNVLLAKAGLKVSDLKGVNMAAPEAGAAFVADNNVWVWIKR